MNSPQIIPTSKGLVRTAASLIQLARAEKNAWHILGDDYVPPEKVREAYGRSYTRAQRIVFSLTIPSIEVLFWLRKRGYMLMATLPVDCNLRQFRQLTRQPHYRRTEGWCTRPAQRFFCQDVIRAGMWLMIRKQPYPGSRFKTWGFQQKFLTKEEYIPSAAEVVYAFTTYHMVRGVCLLNNGYVRTSSVDEDNEHVIVGNNGADGINVCEFRDIEHVNYVGVSSARIAA